MKYLVVAFSLMAGAALAEGEGDFDSWKQGHIAFFTRNGGFDPDMMLVCERFKLVEVLA